MHLKVFHYAISVLISVELLTRGAPEYWNISIISSSSDKKSVSVKITFVKYTKLVWWYVHAY